MMHKAGLTHYEKGLGAVPGVEHTIRRDNVVLDIVKKTRSCSSVLHFHNENAVDEGGVSREMY